VHYIGDSDIVNMLSFGAMKSGLTLKATAHIVCSGPETR